MEDIELAVKDLLKVDDGHGFDHVQRVRRLAVKFALEESADVNIVELASLLHDVDDYKMFGQENATNLTNARRILSTSGVDEETAQSVLEIIRTMGYNKYLDGIRPTSLEGMIVSDADMCDAIGATGILRTHSYALSKGGMFFDKNITPVDEEVSAHNYRSQAKTHSVQHFFDKLLKIPSLLMTESGKLEGQKRSAVMSMFLENLFQEEGADNWLARLERYGK